ncbi:hypothetical protein KVG91_08975 [Pseudomonas sp. SWRI103]|uniref:Uncharacterized protein n=1 Tax=Pseudomonas azadiae TaxID=2843612 RepID=A0ABS6NY47_9PSED|nr:MULTISPECIES: hypothetical protein [Pseudomonas]MBV4452726.1 hypothetical protein [Pseudomonas azadiae]NMF42454.1 hypothetical protein [Pseudomonas sp. SWRI 103]
MKTLELEVGIEGLEGLVCPLIEAMQSLEHLPEFPLQVFRDLVANSLHDVSVSFDGAALTAGNLRGVCRPSRNFELVTAALLALNAYLHR